MLTASNLVYRVGTRNLVDHISARFEPGKIHLIIGPNGAGKSTLVKLLSRLLPPTSGTITYGSADVARFKDRELARHRAVLSQAVEVAFSMPVEELVMMGRYPHFTGRPSPADEKICAEMIRFFDLGDMVSRDYGTLSGGEKQRVHFARVLAQIWRPEGHAPATAWRAMDTATGIAHRYLFLDEPLTFLDIGHQIDFMKKLRQLAAQPDVVIVGVVHDLNLAAKFADRLMLLHQGRILADGNIQQVLTAENLDYAFGVKPVLLTNAATGESHLAFE
jgi:iron complex transport system ATP-binding protein